MPCGVTNVRSLSEPSPSGAVTACWTPVARWCREGLIAINYAARAKGITRHMRAGEARARCPELQCIHVETIGASEEGGGESGAGDATGHGRLTHKACLERYRKASVEIMTLLRRMTKDVSGVGRERTQDASTNTTVTRQWAGTLLHSPRNPTAAEKDRH